MTSRWEMEESRRCEETGCRTINDSARGKVYHCTWESSSWSCPWLLADTPCGKHPRVKTPGSPQANLRSLLNDSLLQAHPFTHVPHTHYPSFAPSPSPGVFLNPSPPWHWVPVGSSSPSSWDLISNLTLSPHGVFKGWQSHVTWGRHQTTHATASSGHEMGNDSSGCLWSTNGIQKTFA